MKCLYPCIPLFLLTEVFFINELILPNVEVTLKKGRIVFLLQALKLA